MKMVQFFQQYGPIDKPVQIQHKITILYQASIYVSVSPLTYLKKSGRITSSAAASILNIKPVLTIQGEKLDLFAKMRGIRQCEKKMITAIQTDIETRFTEVPAELLRIGIAGILGNENDIQCWMHLVQSAFPENSVYYTPLIPAALPAMPESMLWE